MGEAREGGATIRKPLAIPSTGSIVPHSLVPPLASCDLFSSNTLRPGTKRVPYNPRALGLDSSTLPARNHSNGARPVAKVRHGGCDPNFHFRDFSFPATFHQGSNSLNPVLSKANLHGHSLKIPCQNRKFIGDRQAGGSQEALTLEAATYSKGVRVPFTEASILIFSSFAHVVRYFYYPPKFLNTPNLPVIPSISRPNMNVQEMEYVVSGITPSRLHTDPSACIGVLDRPYTLYGMAVLPVMCTQNPTSSYFASAFHGDPTIVPSLSLRMGTVF